MIIGYNNPWFFNQFRAGNYYTPDGVLRQIRSLQPQILRFPGGTLANYYDSQKPGYGFEQTQAKDNYLSRHIDLAINTGVKTTYVANVYQALLNPENADYWILNTIQAIILIPNLAYIELGNEICISGEFMKIADKPGLFESTSSYEAKVAAKAREFLAMCDRFYEEIKSYRPDVKIGLPFQPALTVRNREWNRVLRTWGKNDVEVQHIYLTSRTPQDIEATLIKSLAGAARPVIITEWGWLHGNDSTKNLGDIGQPYYNAFFVNFPLVCQKLGVEMICRHLLYAPGNPYSVLK